MVIGVEEPILIKGIGEIVAKVDSGNSGYNVIHGEDLIIQGDIITFKTENKDGQERRVSKKIKDTINVNIGGGHIQERPVIELNVQFGGQDYKKVLFSITNRKDNEHKVLLSKDFVGKELEALIDVTKDNIADDNVSVDYVTEGAIKNAKNTVVNAVNTFAKGTAAQHATAKKWEDIEKAMLGQGGGPDEDRSIDPKLESEVDGVANLAKLLKSDAELIKAQLPSQESKLQSLRVEVVKDNINVFKMLDYTGGTNQDKNANEQYKKHLEEVFKQFKANKKEQPEDKIKKKQNGEDEEFVVEAVDNTQQLAQPQQADQNTSSDQKDDKEKKVEDPTKEVQGTQLTKDASKMSNTEIEEALKDLQSRKRAVFYLIGFGKDVEGNKLVLGPEMVTNAQGDIDSWNIKISRGKDWTFNAFKPAAEAISKKITEGARGLFALCTEVPEQRKVEFFTSAIFGNVEEGSSGEVPPELIEEYNELNNEYIVIANEMGIENPEPLSSESLQKLIDSIQGGSEEVDMDSLIQEYNSLNDEFKQIADDLGQQGDTINIDDLQALIDLASESSQNKRADELGQNDQGDMHDSTDWEHHNTVENEERKVN